MKQKTITITANNNTINKTTKTIKIVTAKIQIVTTMPTAKRKHSNEITTIKNKTGQIKPGMKTKTITIIKSAA